MVEKILHGPMVPDWFKEVSDARSTPQFLDRALHPEEHMVAHYVHDFEYYQIEVQFTPRSKDRKKARRRADENFRKNVALATKDDLKSKCCVLCASVYFTGVSLFGWIPLKRRRRKLRRPPNRYAVQALEDTLQHPLTPIAKMVIYQWRVDMKKNHTW